MRCVNWKHRLTLAVLPPESFFGGIFIWAERKMKGSEAVMRCRIRAPTMQQKIPADPYPINQNQNKKGEGLNFITVFTAVAFAGAAVFLLGNCGRTKTAIKRCPEIWPRQLLWNFLQRQSTL